VKYWDQQAASIDGVLGGYGEVHARDIEDSRRFLLSHMPPIVRGAEGKPTRALDCGAGIGRVARELLLEHFDRTDLVEPSGVQLDQARRQFEEEGNSKCVEDYY
jgi:protein N-terminal methyltransferase